MTSYSYTACHLLWCIVIWRNLKRLHLIARHVRSNNKAVLSNKRATFWSCILWDHFIIWGSSSTVRASSLEQPHSHWHIIWLIWVVAGLRFNFGLMKIFIISLRYLIRLLANLGLSYKRKQYNQVYNKFNISLHPQISI